MKKTTNFLTTTATPQSKCKISLVAQLVLLLCGTFSANAQWILAEDGYTLEARNSQVIIGLGRSGSRALHVYGNSLFEGGVTFNSQVSFEGGISTPNINTANLQLKDNLAVGGNLIPGTVLTVDGRTYISENDGVEKGFSNLASSNYKDYLLWVEEGIVSKDFAIAEIKDWPDYVFKLEYQLPSLYEVEKSIKENGYLPNMPAAESIEKDGFTVSDMTKRVVKTIEEMVLHSIDRKKQIDAQKEQLIAQQELINNLITRLEKLEIIEKHSK